MGTLSHREASRTYDRIGLLQDTQRFYEDPATSRLLQYGEFTSAESVFEFGCGTGRFARRLFEEYLPDTAHYRGVDVSPRMVQLTRSRIEPYASRAEAVLTDGEPPTGERAECCDRFVSNYVFDLLSHDDIRAALKEAQRMLRPHGLLCVSGISSGTGFFSRAVMGLVSRVQSLSPTLVGGCRPVDVLPFLSASAWQVRHHSKVVAFGIASEVLVAQRR